VYTEERVSDWDKLPLITRWGKEKGVMKTAQVVRLSLLAWCCFILAGCETVVRMYPGPAQPSSEVAVLQLGPDVGIFSIDSRSFDVEQIKDIELLPGTHAVKAVYLKLPDEREVEGDPLSIVGAIRSESPLYLVFEAVAGGKYRLIGSLEEKLVSTQGKVEIRDMVTGQTVASVIGPVQTIGARP
jgi:hypothetical protein